MDSKIIEIIEDTKNRSNSDLLLALKTLKEEFDETKEAIIKLTHHMDYIENSYNSTLKEYEKRITPNKK
jgi:hypothetical protein